MYLALRKSALQFIIKKERFQIKIKLNNNKKNS